MEFLKKENTSHSHQQKVNGSSRQLQKPYRAGTFKTKHQKARTDVIDPVNSGTDNLMCWCSNNSKNTHLSHITSVNSVPHALRVTLTRLRKISYYFFSNIPSPMIETLKKIYLSYLKTHLLVFLIYLYRKGRCLY